MAKYDPRDEGQMFSGFFVKAAVIVVALWIGQEALRFLSQVSDAIGKGLL